MKLDNEFFETLRRSYKPTEVLTLFVGESRPANGTFFYLGNSQVYRYMKEVFEGGEEFLRDFKETGFYLDDLVLHPINEMKKQSARRDQWEQGTPQLARRLRTYCPRCVVTICVQIGSAVADALGQADMSGVPHYVVPFPGNGQQGRFRKRMHEIIPTLPKRKS